MLTLIYRMIYPPPFAGDLVEHPPRPAAPDGCAYAQPGLRSLPIADLQVGQRVFLSLNLTYFK